LRARRARYPFKETYNDTFVLDVGDYDAMRASVALEPHGADFGEAKEEDEEEHEEAED
jgi:hypothetical protein